MMKNQDIHISLNKDSLKKLSGSLVKLRRYSLAGFIAFVVIIYSFVVLRINMLNNAEPDQAQIDTQIKATRIPKIDEEVLAKIKSLQDNSVSVQSLFVSARDNPFNENPDKQ